VDWAEAVGKVSEIPFFSLAAVADEEDDD
jgi:hypothetical protein